jgi:Predicted nucleotide-binding protein containing TIR-like domain
MRPTLFIASSSESDRLALGVQSGLQKVADATTWKQGPFAPGSITLDALIEKATEYDFGVFVFSADDLVRLRGQDQAATRDNVVFEFGLFIAKLGRQRVFMLLPTGTDSPLHLPTDLGGLTGVTYDAERAANAQSIEAALGPACLKIEIAIRQEWSKPSDLTGDMVLLLRYLYRDNGAWMLPDTYARDFAVHNGVPERVDKYTGQGWRRAVRYQMLLLSEKGLAEKSEITSIIYRISAKGRRTLEFLKTDPSYASQFQNEVPPLNSSEWGRTEGPPDVRKLKLGGNDYRLLFAVYDRPGKFLSVYEPAIDQPAEVTVLERARRLEKLGLLEIILEKELDITTAGRDLVGAIKTIADQVYGQRKP